MADNRRCVKWIVRWRPEQDRANRLEWRTGGNATFRDRALI